MFAKLLDYGGEALRGKQVWILHGPATVSGESSFMTYIIHWVKPGKENGGVDPQVRRPA